MQPLAIHQYQNVGIAQTAKLHLATHVALVESKGCRQRAQYLLNALTAKAVQHLPAYHLCLYRHIPQCMNGSRSGDDDLLHRCLLLRCFSFECAVLVILS